MWCLSVNWGAALLSGDEFRHHYLYFLEHRPREPVGADRMLCRGRNSLMIHTDGSLARWQALPDAATALACSLFWAIRHLLALEFNSDSLRTS